MGELEFALHPDSLRRHNPDQVQRVETNQILSPFQRHPVKMLSFIIALRKERRYQQSSLSKQAKHLPQPKHLNPFALRMALITRVHDESSFKVQVLPSVMKSFACGWGIILVLFRSLTKQTRHFEDKTNFGYRRCTVEVCRNPFRSHAQ